MAILDQMTGALATTAVKFAGADRPMPALEFVMHPSKLADAKLEARINDPHMVFHSDGAWTFRGVPVRADVDVSNWTLQPIAAKSVEQ